MEMMPINLRSRVENTVVALLCAIVGLYQCAFAQWPMYRGNAARTGFFGSAVRLPVSAPCWIDSLGRAAVSSPSISGPTLFIGSRDSCVYAIGSATGEIIWKKKTNGWVDASPLVSGGEVFAGSRDGHIHVYSAGDGSPVALLNAGLQLSSPAVTASGSIFSGLGPPLSGFCLYDRDFVVWQSEPGWSLPCPAFSYSSPAIKNNLAIIGTNDGKLHAVRTDTKDTAWTLQTGGGIYLSTPAIDDSVVFFAPGNYDRNIYAIGLNSGNVLWKKQGNSAGGLAKKAGMISPNRFTELLKYGPVMRHSIIAGLRSRGVIVPSLIEPETGLAKKTGPNDFYPYGEMKTSSVAVDSSNVYVVQNELGYPSSRLTLLALNKRTGEEVWHFSELCHTEELGYCSSPIVTNNAVFFGWGEGHVFALDPSAGSVLWQDTLDGNILSSPAIDSQRVYFATMKGKVYAYNLSHSAPGLDFQTSTFCYPNPARGDVSNIQVFVAENATLDLTLFNSSEKPVQKVSQTISANEKYSYHWNISKVANGVYFAMIKVKYANGRTDKKIMKIAVLH